MTETDVINKFRTLGSTLWNRHTNMIMHDMANVKINLAGDVTERDIIEATYRWFLTVNIVVAKAMEASLQEMDDGTFDYDDLVKTMNLDTSNVKYN